MTSPDPDTLSRLADELSAVSHRLGQIGAEVRSLHGPAPAPYPAPVWQPRPPAPSVPPPPLPLSAFPAPPAWQPAPPREPRVTLWDRLGREGAGSRLLAWIGGGVTLAGVVLLLVLAIQRGYIGPVPRVLAGAALGAVLVGIGLALHRREAGRTGGLALAATGFAGLFLDVVAATAGYHFLPVAGGLAAGLVVAAAGVLVAHRWRSQPSAVFVVLGCALCAPFLTGGLDATLVGFLLVLQVATSPVHVAHRWAGLALAAGAPPVVAVLALTGSESLSHQNPTVVLALAVGAGAVQLATAIVMSVRGQQSAVAFAAAAPVPTLLAVSILLAVLGVRARYPGAVVTSAVLAATGAVDGLGTVVRPELLARTPQDAIPTSVIAALATTGVLITAAALIVAGAADRVITEADRASTRARWIVAAVAVLYGSSAALIAAGLTVRPDGEGFRVGQVLVTVCWTLAAIALLLRRIDSAPCRVAGLALVGAAVAKLVLFDLASLDGIPRVTAFLGAGLALLAAGAKYAALVARRPGAH